MQPIRFRFTYTEAEYLSAARLLIWAEKTVIWRLIGVSVVLAFVLITLPIIANFNFPIWAMAFFAIALDGLFAHQIFTIMPRTYFRGDPKFRDEYLLTLSEEGVWLQTAQIDSKLAWSLYKRVIENQSMYVIVYGTDARMMTVVPKRVFKDGNEELAFRQLLNRYVDSRLAPANADLSARVSEYVPSKLEPPDWR